MKRSLLALTILMMTACVPQADNPLTAAGKDPIDTAIFGTWFWHEELESGFIHIGRDETSEQLRLVMVDFDKDGDVELSEFSGHTSSLGGNTYLNLKWVRPLQEDFTGYLLVKYDLKAAKLGIALMNIAAVEKAIKNGTLKGRVTKGQWSSSVHITETQEKLQSFVLDNDAQLYPETTYLPKLIPAAEKKN